MNARETLGKERRWALWIALLAVSFTMLPYLFGYSLVGVRDAFSRYSWLGYNLDDSCVYMTWMRQTADGGFFQRNLFTTQHQVGHQFNLFFVVLGWITALLHLPLITIYHGARLLLGVALLRSVWWLIELLVSDARARRVCYLMVCFSSGLGWLLSEWWHAGSNSPVDVWMPESITWLCLYLNPLFLVSLLLMVGFIGWLLVGERDGSNRPAVYAGLCGLLLGNIHTYDVITVVSVWSSFLLVNAMRARRWDWQPWKRAFIAGGFTFISSAYMYYLMKTEPVFAKRVGVETLSPWFRLYILGFGFILPLACIGVWRIWRNRTEAKSTEWALGSLTWFLPVWAVVNQATAYIPVPYQRKMLMGEHFPLAILAGVGLTWLLRNVKGRMWSLAVFAIVAFMSITNWRFAWRDMNNCMNNRAQTRIQRPYLYAGEVKAIDWIRGNVPAGVPVQSLPWILRAPNNKLVSYDITVASFIPPLTGRPVDAGHWGETPDFPTAMLRWAHFVLNTTPDTWRVALLRETGVQYVLFTQKHNETGDPVVENQMLYTFKHNPPSYLKLIPEASSADADVYKVELPADAGLTK